MLTVAAAQRLQNALRKCLNLQQQIQTDYKNVTQQMIAPFEDMRDCMNYTASNYRGEGEDCAIVGEVPHDVGPSPRDSMQQVAECLYLKKINPELLRPEVGKQVEDVAKGQNSDSGSDLCNQNDTLSKTVIKDQHYIVENLADIVECQEALFRTIVSFLNSLEKDPTCVISSAKLLQLKHKLSACSDVLTNGTLTRSLSNIIDNIIEDEITRCRYRPIDRKDGSEVNFKPKNPAGLEVILEKPNPNIHTRIEHELLKPINEPKPSDQGTFINLGDRTHETLDHNLIDLEAREHWLKFAQPVSSEPVIIEDVVEEETPEDMNEIKPAISDENMEKLIEVNQEQFNRFEDAVWHSLTTLRFRSLRDDYLNMCKCAFYNKRQFMALETALAKQMTNELDQENMAKFLVISQQMFEIMERRLESGEELWQDKCPLHSESPRSSEIGEDFEQQFHDLLGEAGGLDFTKETNLSENTFLKTSFETELWEQDSAGSEINTPDVENFNTHLKLTPADNENTKRDDSGDNTAEENLETVNASKNDSSSIVKNPERVTKSSSTPPTFRTGSDDKITNPQNDTKRKISQASFPTSEGIDPYSLGKKKSRTENTEHQNLPSDKNEDSKPVKTEVRGRNYVKSFFFSRKKQEILTGQKLYEMVKKSQRSRKFNPSSPFFFQTADSRDDQQAETDKESSVDEDISDIDEDATKLAKSNDGASVDLLIDDDKSKLGDGNEQSQDLSVLRVVDGQLTEDQDQEPLKSLSADIKNDADRLIVTRRVFEEFENTVTKVRMITNKYPVVTSKSETEGVPTDELLTEPQKLDDDARGDSSDKNMLGQSQKPSVDLPGQGDSPVPSNKSSTQAPRRPTNELPGRGDSSPSVSTNKKTSNLPQQKPYQGDKQSPLDSAKTFSKVSSKVETNPKPILANERGKTFVKLDSQFPDSMKPHIKKSPANVTKPKMIEKTSVSMLRTTKTAMKKRQASTNMNKSWGKTQPDPKPKGGFLDSKETTSSARSDAKRNTKTSRGNDNSTNNKKDN